MIEIFRENDISNLDFKTCDIGNIRQKCTIKYKNICFSVELVPKRIKY